MHLIRETRFVRLFIGVSLSVVDSYESYGCRTEALSSRQNKLSSGKMYLIRESLKI